MVDVQTFGLLVTAASVSVAAIYYSLSLRNSNLTRQAQLFMQLSQLISSKEAMEDNWELIAMEWKDLDDFYGKYDSSVNLQNFAKRWHLWFTMDTAGLLMKKGLIDKEMVYYLMGGYWGLWAWRKFEPVIRHQRVRNNMPELGVWFEYLAKEFERFKVQRGQTLEIPEDWGSMNPDK